MISTQKRNVMTKSKQRSILRVELQRVWPGRWDLWMHVRVACKKHWDILDMVCSIHTVHLPLHYLLTSGIDLKICGEVESESSLNHVFASVCQLLSYYVTYHFQYYGRYDGKKCISKCTRPCFPGRDSCEPSYSSISSSSGSATHWTTWYSPRVRSYFYFYLYFTNLISFKVLC